MSFDEEVSRSELFELVQYFSKNPFRARDSNAKVEGIQRKCLQLFAKDYKFTTITNNNGDLCGHYPLKLVILEAKLNAGESEKTDSQKANDARKLRDLFVKARFARCRSRFVVPVILFEGKNICRSATLSGGAEIYGRSGYDFLFAGGESIPDNPLDDLNGVNGTGPLYSSGDYDLFDRIRGQDIRLLKTLRVKYICDLMVEKKKVKFGMRVTSSEKVDKIQRYSDFCLCSVPYPGCEFFRDFKDNEYNADGLHFNWQQDYVDTKFSVPDLLLNHKGIEWNNYQSWDLVTLTQNYLHLLISCVKDGDGGLLIHCISGWDRTPLFISLLRMSLWADGRIHQSLSPAELLFLTIAYDWFLFGHGLPERLQRGEEVFFFCFNFLKNIASDDFSVNSSPRRPSDKRSDSIGQFDPGAVLLEDRLLRGSNSSLSSCSSITSEQRTSFFIGQEIAEDSEMAPSSSFTSFSSFNGAYAAYHSPPRSHADHEDRHQSTSPLPVPRRSRKNSSPCDQKSSSSSVCGSWQLISGTGSPNGTTSVRDSPISALGHGSSSTSLAESVDECSDRQLRLGAVRSLFLQLYFKAVGCTNKFETGSSFSSIFDQVTEKIREGWGTVI